MSTPPSSQEPEPVDPGPDIVSVRDFPFTRAQVYAAFSDPARLARWWGPAGFSNRIEIFDLKPGGRWHLTMRGPDGTAYENASHFVEVVPFTRVVFDHDDPVHRFRMTITFADRGEGCRLTWRMRFDDPAERERVRAYIVPANEQNFDRLQEHLSPQT